MSVTKENETIVIAGGRLSGNPTRGFPNLAWHPDPTAILIAELEDAGIHPHEWGNSVEYPKNQEVKQTVTGFLEPSGWSFRRAWYYWVAEGPGLPPETAWKLHREHGQSVRVEGHCGCPSPAYRRGFGVGLYHVDSPDGLKALADAVKGVLEANPEQSDAEIYGYEVPS